MEAICPSETLVSTYKTIRRHNSEDQNANYHCRENLIHFTRLLETLMFVEYVEDRRIN
jgi:hypothetical protein